MQNQKIEMLFYHKSISISNPSQTASNMAMTQSAFNFNINAVPFVPQEEQNAALALAALQREDRALNDTIDALLALRLDDTRNGNEENSDYEEDYEPMDIDPNPEHEYEDAFLEYAQVNGLWGFPGSEIIPTEDEMTNMRHNFDQHWNNLPAQQQIEEEYEEEIHHINPNRMFVPECAECGAQAGENIQLYGCNYDHNLYCTSCWERYDNDDETQENRTALWIQTAADFQDYTDDMMPHLDPNRESADEDYLSAWIQYLNHCYHPLTRAYLEELGDENNWLGVRPGVEPPSPQL